MFPRRSWPIRLAGARRRDFLASVGAGATIARARKDPAIGISRVGGSPRRCLAPETHGLPPELDFGFKNSRDLEHQVDLDRQCRRVVCSNSAPGMVTGGRSSKPSAGAAVNSSGARVLHAISPCRRAGEQVAFFILRRASGKTFEGVPANLITTPAFLHRKI